MPKIKKRANQRKNKAKQLINIWFYNEYQCLDYYLIVLIKYVKEIKEKDE